MSTLKNRRIVGADGIPWWSPRQTVMLPMNGLFVILFGVVGLIPAVFAGDTVLDIGNPNGLMAVVTNNSLSVFRQLSTNSATGKINVTFESIRELDCAFREVASNTPNKIKEPLRGAIMFPVESTYLQATPVITANCVLIVNDLSVVLSTRRSTKLYLQICGITSDGIVNQDTATASVSEGQLGLGVLITNWPLSARACYLELKVSVIVLMERTISLERPPASTRFMTIGLGTADSYAMFSSKVDVNAFIYGTQINSGGTYSDLPAGYPQLSTQVNSCDNSANVTTMLSSSYTSGLWTYVIEPGYTSATLGSSTTASASSPCGSTNAPGFTANSGGPTAIPGSAVNLVGSTTTPRYTVNSGRPTRPTIPGSAVDSGGLTPTPGSTVDSLSPTTTLAPGVNLNTATTTTPVPVPGANIGGIIGGIFGAVGGLLVILATVLIAVKLKRKSSVHESATVDGCSRTPAVNGEGVYAEISAVDGKPVVGVLYSNPTNPYENANTINSNGARGPVSCESSNPYYGNVVFATNNVNETSMDQSRNNVSPSGETSVGHYTNVSSSTREGFGDYRNLVGVPGVDSYI